MTDPNPQLQAALARFAAQPGITPDQAAQLTAAVTQDARSLQRLNDDAAAGHLTGFALPSVGAAPNLTGTYDKASGVVTLPPGDFLSTGSVPGNDLVASLRVQDMTARYAHTTWVEAAGNTQPVLQNTITNLQNTLNGAPVLAEQVKLAASTVDPGSSPPRMHLEEIDSLSGTVAGGTYNGHSKTISLPPASLDMPPSQFQATGVVDMTFVLGHEIQHGFNYPSYDAATQAFYTDAIAIARDSNPANDYTAPIGNLIQSERENEARAHIAGWNALVSRTQEKGPTTLTSMSLLNSGYSHDFIQQDSVSGAIQPRSGLTFNADNTLPMTSANVAQMGRNYFDKAPLNTPGLQPHQTTSIGYHGDSDYPNQAGSGAVGRAIWVEQTYAQPLHGAASRMEIDMASLRLREDLLERNGIYLKGGNGSPPQPYYDISQSPPALGHFHHTHNGGHLNELGGAHQHHPVAPRTNTAARHPEPLVNDYVTALQAGNEEAARSAAMAFAASERGRQLIAQAEQHLLEKQQRLPGRDNPLFQQALDCMQRLGPQAGGYADLPQMDSMAGAIACQASQDRLTRIESIRLLPNGDYLATGKNHNGAFTEQSVTDQGAAWFRPLQDSLQQLDEQTRSQQQEQQQTRQQQQADPFNGPVR